MLHKITFVIIAVFFSAFCFAKPQSFTSWPWQTDSTGFKSYIIKPGNAVHPDSNSYVRVKYSLTLVGEEPGVGGTVEVDTSVIHRLAKTSDVFLEQMMPGFSKAATMLGEGGEGYFYVPDVAGDPFIYYIVLITKLETEEFVIHDSYLNTTEFWETTIRHTKKAMGPPDSTYTHWSHANFGGWGVVTFTTGIFYRQQGLELTYNSDRRNKRDRKTLSYIKLDASSPVRINDSLRLQDCDMEAVSKLFGAVGDGESHYADRKTVEWYYELTWNAQMVNAVFEFSEDGTLRSLELNKRL